MMCVYGDRTSFAVISVPREMNLFLKKVKTVLVFREKMKMYSALSS